MWWGRLGNTYENGTWKVRVEQKCYLLLFFKC
jgi:hypothetical protein